MMSRLDCSEHRVYNSLDDLKAENKDVWESLTVWYLQ